MPVMSAKIRNDTNQWDSEYKHTLNWEGEKKSGPVGDWTTGL